MSFTEEAFLFSSFQEAVKVWRKGSGQATFSLQIVDGKTDLQLSFKLGHPSDLHFEPDVHLVQDHDQDYVGQPCRHHRRKGPARREKDRLRAKKHQAQIQPQDVIDHRNEAVSAEVILPFHGKLLPVHDNVVSTVVAAAPAVTPPASCGPPPQCAPSKQGQQASHNFVTKKKVDADQAKKKLFVARQMPYRESPKPSTGYARKEEELWSKLFT